MFEEEKKIFDRHLKTRNLKHSMPREKIVDITMKIERHMTIDELAEIVKKKNPSIGYTTVYRTMKLMCECGLCREMRLEDGITRYEHHYGHAHHDHLICVKCGNFIEVVEPEIERLQNKLVKKYGFEEKHHRMEIYGTCSDCIK